ncbi:MAG TPA: hypothetical protein VG165_05625 [Solirubrobacteraceae bacterium]|jgi:hypothetical protein|nr:hypothetical protein [Solirubrobacteraceae bacterium]
MPDLSTIREQVRDRLNELEGLIAPLRAEFDELQAIAEKFTSNGAAAAAAPVKRARRAAAPKAAASASPAASAKPARAPRRSRRTNGAEGGRAQQAIGLIAERPGMTVPEMAKAMGIGSNYLYRVLPQLQRDGKVSKQGKGYHPVDTSPKAVAADQD